MNGYSINVTEWHTGCFCAYINLGAITVYECEGDSPEAAFLAALKWVNEKLSKEKYIV